MLDIFMISKPENNQTNDCYYKDKKFHVRFWNDTKLIISKYNLIGFTNVFSGS